MKPAFAQWGSLAYTWAVRGQQPVVKTGGKRKGYKVFGLIEYFTGRLFWHGHDGALQCRELLCLPAESAGDRPRSR